MAWKEKLGARCVNNLHKTNRSIWEWSHPVLIPACKYTVGKYVHYHCLLKMEFCFLKPNILVKYYCVEREPLGSPRGLIKDYVFPQAKIMLPYHAKMSYYNAIILTELMQCWSQLFATGSPWVLGLFIFPAKCQPVDKEMTLTVWCVTSTWCWAHGASTCTLGEFVNLKDTMQSAEH